MKSRSKTNSQPIGLRIFRGRQRSRRAGNNMFMSRSASYLEIQQLITRCVSEVHVRVCVCVCPSVGLFVFQSVCLSLAGWLFVCLCVCLRVSVLVPVTQPN